MMPPGGVRRAIGTVQAYYNVPFVIGMLLGAGILMLILGTIVIGPARWLLLGVGIVPVLMALSMSAYSVFRHPELLRSERTTTFNQTVVLLGNDELSDHDKDRIAHSLEQYLVPAIPKRLTGPIRERPAQGSRDEDHNDA